MVIWIIGLSGSGKSYLAKKIFSHIKRKKILIDGDDVRKYITYKLKYNKRDRLKNSILISDLCKFLENKGFVVICSILSIFPQHQKNNRKKFKKYFQIFLDVNKNQVAERNNKNIYKRKNVVGKSINFPKPYRSDIVIKNNFKPMNKIFISKILKKINVIN